MKKNIVLILLTVAITYSSVYAGQKEAVFISLPLPTTSTDKLLACTPVIANIERNKTIVNFKAVSGTWGRAFLPIWTYEENRYESFHDCLLQIPEYEGRYTAEHVRLFENNQLVAGMPLEFAVMQFGPPDEFTSLVSQLNPHTGEAETLRTFVWTDLQNRQGLFVALAFLGAAASAVGAHEISSGDFGRAADALTVAAAADIARDIVLLTNAGRAVAHVSEDRTIHLLIIE